MYQNRNKSSRPYKRNNSSSYVLPPASLLEKYEAIVPGSSEKIMDIVDVEQDHRHRWENRALTSYIWSYRIGQLFGLLSFIAILYASLYSLKILENEVFAAAILASGCALHFIISMLSIKRKKFFEKPIKRNNR